MQTFVVRDMEQQNPTIRMDARQFDPRLLRTADAIRAAAERHPTQLRLLPLGALVTPDLGITAGATPRGGIYIEDGVPFVRVQNVRRGYLDLADIVFIDEETHHEDLRRSSLALGDVLVTITGATYGLVAKVTKEVVPGNVNQHVVRLRLNPGYDPDFLVGYLNSHLGRDQFERAYTGSSRPALDYPTLARTEVLVPSENEVMDRIGAIVKDGLAKADEAHRRALVLLSTEGGTVSRLLGLSPLPPQRARTFVVDPTGLGDRLDAVSRDPDYEAVVAAVKNGTYAAEPVTAFAKDTTRKVVPSDEPENEFVPVDLTHFDPDFGTMIPPAPCLGIDIEGTRVVLYRGEVAVSRLRFYLRKVAVVPNISRAVATMEVRTFGCDNPADAEYLWVMLRQDFAIRQMQHTVTGSSRPRAESEDILNVVVPLPPPSVKSQVVREVRRIYDSAREQWEMADSIRESTFEEVAKAILD